MAFPTANMWFRDVPSRFITVGGNLDAALKESLNGPRHSGRELQKFTGICARDPRHGAGFAQITRPALARCLKQTTLLHVAAAEVITVEIGTFRPGRSSHND